MQVNFNSNVNQYNPQFKSLKGMQFRSSFDPNYFVYDAKVVKSFLENKAIKDFCKKNDVIAVFQSYLYNDIERCSLKLIYEKIKGPANKTRESFMQKFKEKFFKPQNKYKAVEDNTHTIEFYHYRDLVKSDFRGFISNISKRDLKYAHNACLKSESKKIEALEEEKKICDFFENFSYEKYNK